jgi:hypothetical protein
MHYDTLPNLRLVPEELCSRRMMQRWRPGFTTQPSQTKDKLTRDDPEEWAGGPLGKLAPRPRGSLVSDGADP